MQVFQVIAVIIIINSRQVRASGLSEASSTYNVAARPLGEFFRALHEKVEKQRNKNIL